MSEWGPIVAQVAAGIGLAACAGLRAFLPLLVVGACGRAGWLGLSGPFEWLATWPALVVFGVAVVVEILADKIPVVDHLLDVVQGVVKPAAGAALVVAVVTDLTPLQATVLGILGGGGTAAVVHVAKAKVRLLSSALTSGLGNPILSLMEDVVTGLGSVVAILAPLLVILFFLSALFVLFLLLRRFHLRSARFENP
jgi:hypothetical protein